MSEERGPQDAPELYGLTRDAGGYRLTRRGFLQTAAALAATAALPGAVHAQDDAEGATQPKVQGNLLLLPEGAVPKDAPRAHLSAVCGLALAGPDSSLLLSGGRDGMLKTWSLPEGKLVSSDRPEVGALACFAVARGGHLVGVAGEGREIRLWDLTAKATSGGALRTHMDVRCLAAALDGQLLILAGPDNDVDYWFTHSMGEDRTLDFRASSLVLSPDGKMMASGSGRPEVVLRSVPQAKKLQVLQARQGGTAALAFDPSGKRLATAGADRTVTVWALGRGEPAIKLKPQPAAIGAVAFAPDGRLLAVAGKDGAVRLWQGPEGSLRATLQAEGPLTAVVFTADGSRLVAGTATGRLFVWELGGAKRHWLLFDRDAAAKATNLVEGRSTDAAGVCTCDTVVVAAGASLPAGSVCVCDTVEMPASPYGTGGGGGGGHYWFPS